uniref:BTB domain-containing protein n=1 Tax=Panagrolaimus davidi TaxID=227884 RepID=A0A914QB87_9BILA
MSCSKLSTTGKIRISARHFFRMTIPKKMMSTNCSNLWNRDDKKFVFVVDGKEIKVHKVVVETKSPAWKEMIQSRLKKSEDGKIAIDDFDFQTVETALKFCYDIEEKHLWSVQSAIEVFKFADRYEINDLKISVETFLSSQLSPINVCALANLSILTNSFKLRRKCFEYLFECIQKKIFVADLETLDKDFSSLFSQSPNLDQTEIFIESDDQQIQNEPPQIRRSFVTKVIEIAAFMVIASFLIGTLLKNDVDSFFQSINQIWRNHIFCGTQLFWFAVYFTIDHFQVLRQQKYLKWISLLIFVAISGFLVASCINYYGHIVAVFATVLTLPSTIVHIVTALFDSYDYANIYIWPYCLIPNVFILLIKEFLPFPVRLFLFLSISTKAF